MAEVWNIRAGDMKTVSLEEAEGHLGVLVRSLRPGEEVVITQNEVPIARLVGGATHSPRVREPGVVKDKVRHIADDFDAPLEDFGEYME